MHRMSGLSALAFSLIVGVASAVAQTERTPETTSTMPAGATEESDDSSASAATLEELEKRLTEQERENSARKKEIEEMQKRHAEEIEGLAARLDMAEEAQLDSLDGAAEEIDRELSIYGFFDVTLFKYLLDEDHPAYGVAPEKLSFTVSNLNLYLAGTMTESLRALVELRFTFMPHGAESSLTPYERVDTSVLEPHTTAEIQLGGVIIERVQLTWQPHDYIGVTAGRFLTPFGIWNVDHGSPVLLPVQPPYLIVRQYLPLAQTGIQLHGRFFPREDFFVDYAITAANGRGPTETAYDLEDDKALGLQLKFTYQGNKVNAAVGGYGYYGHTTDITKELDLSDPSQLFKMTIDNVSEYREWTGAIDFLLELYGVRLQAEYVRGIVKYDVRPIRVMPVVNIQDPSGELQPDYIKWDGYVLLAWQLPLDSLIGDMRLTPYGMVERSVMDDSFPDLDAITYRVGLNFKPNSFVVLKFDAVYVTFSESEMMNVPWWILNGQLAVSF